MCQGHRELCFQCWFIKTRKRSSCIGWLQLSSCDGSVIRIPRLLYICHSVQGDSTALIAACKTILLHELNVNGLFFYVLTLGRQFRFNLFVRLNSNSPSEKMNGHHYTAFVLYHLQKTPAYKNLWIKNLLAEICYFDTKPKIQEPVQSSKIKQVVICGLLLINNSTKRVTLKLQI